MRIDRNNLNISIPSFLFISMFMMLITGGCVKKREYSLRNEARDLYMKCQGISSKYVDSLSHSEDSLTLLGLMDRYDHAITNLNYDYPPGTDYELSEGENDTLRNLSDRIIFLRDSLLYEFAHPVTADTLNIEEPEIPANQQ